MSKAKHTPLPWKWWTKKTGRPPEYDLAKLLGANGRDILGMYGGEGFNALGKSKTDKANAEYIIKACNNFPEMVELLQHIVDCNCLNENAYQKARALLASLEE